VFEALGQSGRDTSHPRKGGHHNGETRIGHDISGSKNKRCSRNCFAQFPQFCYTISVPTALSACVPTRRPKNISLISTTSLAGRNMTPSPERFVPWLATDREKFHKFTMEAGWEWVVSLDALQAIECRMLDEPGIQHQIAVDVDAAKRRNRIEKAVKEATSEGVGFR
jgi:hypothetical protein